MRERWWGAHSSRGAIRCEVAGCPYRAGIGPARGTGKSRLPPIRQNRVVTDPHRLVPRNNTSPPESPKMPRTTLTNWSGVHSCTPSRFVCPSSVGEVCGLVKEVSSSGGTLRVIGALHSPNDGAMCEGEGSVMVSLVNLSRIHSMDPATGLVDVDAGCTLTTLCEALDGVGLALPSLGSIVEQTIGGCMSTGTHGTGIRFGVLSRSIVRVELVNGEGEVVSLSQGEGLPFRASLCSLGVLGVVTRVTLQAVPAFDLDMEYNPAGLEDTLVGVAGRVAASPYYRFWWIPHTGRVWEWSARPVPPAGGGGGRSGSSSASSSSSSTVAASTATAPRRGWGLVAALSSTAAWFWDSLVGYHTLQALIRASQFFPATLPYINSLYSFLFFRRGYKRTVTSRKGFTFNCLFKQDVNEWALPVEVLPEAMLALKDMIVKGGYTAHFPVEVRFSSGDDMPLSPAFGRASVWIGIISYRPYGITYGQNAPYFREFERLMASFGGRPHWAKIFDLQAPQLRGLYPQFQDFLDLRARMDPKGVFLNPWAKRVLLAGEGEGGGEGSSGGSVGVVLRRMSPWIGASWAALKATPILTAPPTPWRAFQ